MKEIQTAILIQLLNQYPRAKLSKLTMDYWFMMYGNDKEIIKEEEKNEEITSTQE